MGWMASTIAEPTSFRLFLNTGLKFMTFNDFLPPTCKTVLFGLIIGMISCFQGMRVRGGTEGVGRAATSSVVLSSLFIIISDVVLVRFVLTFFPS
jgi:phospholipid/cholesterol/gamma-HCH transport system permease protein